MSGNRKHGFLSGARRALKPLPWWCDGCQKHHPYERFRNGTRDGRSLCEAAYYRERRELCSTS